MRLLSGKKPINHTLFVRLFGILIIPLVAVAEELPDLDSLSLSQLTNVKITSAGKKEQNLSDAAAALYVITAEDIRRSSATALPELFRHVPGMHVAQLESSRWSVSVRGFSALYNGKLLVLIDGRSIYSPTFGGVEWENHDILLDDIERIEVIRGPGAALWGANAVNGVINILTKNSADTQGLRTSVGSGNEDHLIASSRYGGKLGEKANYRVYGKYSSRDDTELLSGGDAGDAWETVRGGVRTDISLSDRDTLMLQSEAHYVENKLPVFVPTATAPFSEEVEDTGYLNGQHVMGRWNRKYSETSDLHLQLYFDRTSRAETYGDSDRKVYDSEIQYRFSPLERHDIVSGAGFRLVDTDFGTRIPGFATVNPGQRETNLFTWFVHDEITLIENTLNLILGAKFEENDFTGFEFQPNARMIWTPTERTSVWAAVSRAVRTPTVSDDDTEINLQTIPGDEMNPATFVSLRGDRASDSEDLLAYEAGVRSQLSNRFSIDVSAFYFNYRDLSTAEPRVDLTSFDGAAMPPVAILPLLTDNLAKGEVYGVEALANFQATDWWRLIAWYSWTDISLKTSNGGSGEFIFGVDRENPDNQFMIRSQMDLPRDVEFESSVRFVDAIPAFSVDSYVEVDLRLGIDITDDLELSIIGKNLVDSAHQEGQSEIISTNVVEIERSVFGRLTLNLG